MPGRELVIETDRIEISLFSCLEVSGFRYKPLEGSRQAAWNEADGLRPAWCIAVECHPGRIAGNGSIRGCDGGRDGLDVALLLGSQQQAHETEGILDFVQAEAVATNA